MSKAEEQAAKEKAAPHQSEQIFKGKKLTLRVDTISEPGGRTYKREIVEHPGAVVMVAVDENNQLVLVQQWRRAVAKVLLELPAGTLDNNEAPEVCAQRELQEEIGYKAKKLNKIGGFYSAPGFSTEYLHLFLAEDLEPSQLDPDEGEEIDIIRLSLDEALAMIKEGKISDAKSIAGILQYKLLHG